MWVYYYLYVDLNYLIFIFYYQQYILFTWYNYILFFYYSNKFVLLQALIKKGLIPLLIKELSLYVKMHQICHTHPDMTKIQSIDTSTSNCTSLAGSSSMGPTTSAIEVTCSPPKDDNIATNGCVSDCSLVCE